MKNRNNLRKRRITVNQFSPVEAIAVRGVEYDLEEDVYHLYNQTLFVTDTRNLVNDKYFVIDPDELGEYVLEIG